MALHRRVPRLRPVVRRRPAAHCVHRCLGTIPGARMTGSDHLVFEEPWQAKAFALTVALHERGLYSWQEWSETLGAKIAAGEAHGDASEYYRNWLAALEGLLAEKGVTT